MENSATARSGPSSHQSESGFDVELRISPLPVLIVLFLAGPILYTVSVPLGMSGQVQHGIILFSLTAFLSTGVALALLQWSDLAGRWMTMVALTVGIYGSALCLGAPVALNLVAVSVVISASLISLPAMGVTAVCQTALPIVLFRNGWGAADGATVTTAVVLVWLLAGAMLLLRRPIDELAYWTWTYYQRAQELLEDARERQAKYAQALEDSAQMNIQLKRMNSLAQGLRRAAEEARTAKEEFVANVSHELRTPLNMIIGFSEMILHAPDTYGRALPPMLLADLAVVHRNAAHLAELIDDVLDLSQIEAEQMALTKENTQLSELVEAAAIAVRPLFESKGLHIKTRLPEDLPALFCDRTRIREVFLNLLSNAGRFVEHGGATVTADRQDDHILVAVADTGPGIAAEDMGRLFQPFQQLDSSIRRRYSGSGLGLCISKRIIEMHGGKIWVESQLGSGTVFYVELPLAAPSPLGSGYRLGLYPGWEYLQRTRPSMAPQVSAPPRFVLVDKDLSFQRLLSRYLDGVEIVSVPSVPDVMQELAEHPSQAVLINERSVASALVDLDQADLPGDVPVLVCSVPGIHEVAADLGVADYLVKPISRDRLLAALERIGPHVETVLIVDDEPDVLRLFRRMLSSSGADYRVLRAMDGREALNLLRSHHPDVVLLDLVMPDMDGFCLLDVMDQDPDLRTIPVIVISALDPAGQPIMSNALAVTRRGGLSMYQLLNSIRALSEVFSVGRQSAGQALTETPPA